MAAVTTQEELRRLYRAPKERTLRKELDHLDEHCRRFIAHSPFVVLATTNLDGTADATPRGGEPGFVTVADERTLLIPDRPGNNRLDTLSNLVATPGVGLLFLVPGMDETLRVNGTAEIRDDEELKARFTEGRPPATVLTIHVREAFLHCGKALMRSKLWDPARHIERSELPTLGEMIRDQIGSTEAPESQELMVERYKAELY
jgi:PPOX class probable FMN-dependent enzyme